MRIKKFLGSSIKEAAAKMKAELGPEAIILSSRKVSRNGLLSFIEKDTFEVTAAVDSEVSPPIPSRSAQRTTSAFEDALMAARGRPRSTAGEPSAENTLESLRKLSEHFEAKSRSVQTEPMPRPGDTGSRMDLGELFTLRGDVDEIKSSLREITDHLKYERMPSLPPALKEAFMRLIENGMEQEAAADIVQGIYARNGDTGYASRKELDLDVIKEITRNVRIADPIRPKRKRARVVALVGPTGVGKTTTIAKLAAIGKLVEGQNVALLSADTYRIGAIEQLRTFASIADIPMEIVYKPADVTAALKTFKSKDTVYFDTVGRSQRMKKDLVDLQKFLAAAQPDEVHLVLSASTNAATMNDIVERFSVLKPNRIIFSKLDEAATLGSLMTVLRRRALPVSYVTTGQGVPDDITPAEPLKIATMIYSGAMSYDV